MHDIITATKRPRFMLEDFLYELLPAFGFAVCASCIFTILIFKNAKGVLKIWLAFAVSDLLLGVSLIYAGFYGVLFSIYGNAGETLNPFECFPAAFHVPLFIFYDHLQLTMIIFATLDRLINTLIPVSYVQFSKTYIKLCSFLLVFSCVFLSTFPFFESIYENRENNSIQIGIACLLGDILSENDYIEHVFLMQWIPIICIGVLVIVLIIYACRHLKHKWSYNWSEDESLTRQAIMAIFVRCFLAALSIHLPMLFLSQVQMRNQFMPIKDYIIRITYAVIVLIFQPMWHLMIVEKYSENIGMFFNRYSYNTERKWQSAADPPIERITGMHMDRHGSPNPFGSWYSTTGNITGDAGVPIDQQRSISFYNNA